jgi:hypothetical protein
MPRRELGRRVDALEQAAGADASTEIGRVLAQLTDQELEAADKLHRHADLWERCAERVVAHHLDGATPSQALGRAALEVHAEAVAAGRLTALYR